MKLQKRVTVVSISSITSNLWDTHVAITAVYISKGAVHSININIQIRGSKNSYGPGFYDRDIFHRLNIKKEIPRGS